MVIFVTSSQAKVIGSEVGKVGMSMHTLASIATGSMDNSKLEGEHQQADLCPKWPWAASEFPTTIAASLWSNSLRPCRWFRGPPCITVCCHVTCLQLLHRSASMTSCALALCAQEGSNAHLGTKTTWALSCLLSTHSRIHSSCRCLTMACTEIYARYTDTAGVQAAPSMADVPSDVPVKPVSLTCHHLLPC